MAPSSRYRGGFDGGEARSLSERRGIAVKLRTRQGPTPKRGRRRLSSPSGGAARPPPEAFSLANLPRTLDILAGGAGQPVHALYATTQFWSLDGQPATDWTLNWVHDAIQNAPHPKHG